VALVKKCRHGRGLSGSARRRAWRRCGCTWVADLRVEGRREYVSLGADEQTASARHAQLVADVVAGNALRPTSAAVADVAEAWLAEHARRGRKPRTLAAYRGHVAHITAYFTGDVGAITSRDVRDFRRRHEAAGRAPGYVSDIVGSLMGVLRHAVEAGLISSAPDRPATVREDRGRRRRPSLAECERLIDHLPRDWRDAGELVLLTGLRVGELLALTPEAVDLGAGRLEVRATRGKAGVVGTPKTRSSERTIMLTPRAQAILAARIAQARPGEYLWEGSVDGAARHAMREARRRAGITGERVGWHSLRHAATALLDASGLPLRSAAQQLGHGAHTAMTLGYGWTAEAADVEAVDAARARLTRHAAPPSP
jgi:integrase